MDQSLSNYTNKNMPSSNPENYATNPMKNSNLDDNVIEKQVRDTHHPDGTDVDVKTLVYFADKILGHAKTNAAIDADSTSVIVEHIDVDAHQNAVRTLNSLSNITDKLACEIPCNRSSDRDGHITALSLLHTVRNFHWDAKLALILACFALKHEEFWLLPPIMELSVPLKSKFDALTKLVHSVLESTRCIMQLMELLSTHLTADVPAMVTASITIPSDAEITSFTSMGHEISSSQTELLEQATLILKINEFLKKQSEECNRIIEEQKDLDFRHSFNRLLETSHIDNMEFLKILINPRDDPLPLFDGATKKRVSLEVLRRRNVLLLISGLDVSLEELLILHQKYMEEKYMKQWRRMEALYELVWVPIVDPSITYTDAMDMQFEDMKNSMPWYSVYHPSYVDRAVKKSIGDRWHFRRKPILVVLDPQGKELSPNAMHMMWIWGNTAFPFTTAREEALWRNETLRLELLVNGMDPTILDWVKQDQYIFLYGGDDIEWIRRFTGNARAMATAAHIPLEMAYVGKSKENASVRRVIATINVEKLSYCWNETTLVWFFWTRLESMLFSRIQLRQADDQDHIMLLIKKLLSYDKDGSWALPCRGSQILTIGHGSALLQTLADFDLWKEHIPTRGFDSSFKDYYDKLHGAENNGCRFEFPQELISSSNPENRLLTSTNLDDDVIEKQVLNTHLSDCTDVDVKTLVYIADQILMAPLRKLEGKSRKTNAHQNAVLTLNSLSHIIDKLTCEMLRKRSSERDGHTTTLFILHTVGNFHWEAKLALILACFSLNHGEFWLLPQIMELSAPLKSKFNALTKLVHTILESTLCIIQLKELPSTHLSADVPAMDAALNSIPSAVYWNVKGVIACAAQITGFTSMRYEISSFDMQSWEQSSIIIEINVLYEFLKKQLEECNRVIEDRKDLDFKHSFNRLLETSHTDNMEILKILINPRDDPQPLFDGAIKKRVSLEVLRRRNVLLLISGLDMSLEELLVLEQIYSESRIQGSRMDVLYEVVWVPIGDPSITYTEAMDIQFEDMKNNMPWYSVYHPSNVDRAVKKSIGDRWNFRHKPILVVLDTQGKELSPNAMHMMWIWGSTAFPFTTAREEALWRNETWGLELLVSGMDQTILDWVKQDKYIILYGGDDIEWIRRFTSNAQAMATAAHIPLEMAYIGKSKNNKNTRRMMDIINVEKLSYFLNDTTLVWFFWTRLKSMLFSKNQLKRDDDQDPLMLQIKKLLSYEKEGSWALLARGSLILTNGYGSTMLATIVDFDQWKEHIPTRGFDLSFKEYHDKLHIEASNCCRLEFPHDAPGIPKDVGCPECLQVMGKHISFLCCHD